MVSQTSLPLTVIFTTFNEAPNIQAALDSVAQWAGEIIVVDSFSTDGTVEVVQKFGSVRLFQRAYFGPADQKNWAIPQAQNEWVLLIDADERATPDMHAEIADILRGYQNNKNGSSELILTIFDGYWVGFTHFFMGKRVRFSGWQNDKTIRLIQRDKCRYNDNRVHEEIKKEGLSVGRLKAKFDHYTFRNITHFVQKQERYATWSAIDHDKKTGLVTAFHLVIKPFFRFFKHYFLKLGFLDGKIGFIIAAVAAWSVFLRYVKIIENRQIKQQSTDI
ncbi:MAG: glycosyltransferase family 2 protein [Saprospiraceae bacterium]|nr:glycosyltransferase family 2 protein [Saprospiraceae bacterium]